MLHRVLARSVAVTFIACSSAMLAGCPNGKFPDPTVVITDNAIVHGTIGDGVRKFLGIPYAAPPTGPNRFRPPQPPPVLLSLFDATKPGNVCPQSTQFGAQTSTEDCLNLNVTTPYPAGVSLPVMVWIHGGGFVFGAGSSFNAANLVKTGNIVVVTVNYRLGALGFLAASALDDGPESTGHTGNYGIEDQQAALRWVNRNIAFFGGDPATVTIAGESAGAFSVCAHLVSPGAAGLFSRAIVQSGPCAFPYKMVSDVKQSDAEFIAKLKCNKSIALDVATCLRSPGLSVSSIVAAQAAPAEPPSATPFPFGPSVGGSEIPKQPANGLGSVPLLLGGTQLENGAFIRASSAPMNKDDYEAMIKQDFWWNPNVLTHYPWKSSSNGTLAVWTVMTDNTVLNGLSPCYNAQSFQLQHAKNVPIFAYEFSEWAPPVFPGLDSGPLHAAELQYLFPSPWNTGPQWPLVEQLLANEMTIYWTNFVRSGNPNLPESTGLPAWPEFKVDGQVLQLGTPIHLVDVSTAHQCPFWAGLEP